MGGRWMPLECEHGRVIDWGDFGPDPDDGAVGAEECPECATAKSGGRPSDAGKKEPTVARRGEMAAERTGVTRWWCRDCNRLFRSPVTYHEGQAFHAITCPLPMERVRVIPYPRRADRG